MVATLHQARSKTDALPPGFGLYAVAEPRGFILIRDSTHKAAEAVRPVGVGYEKTQNGPAEEFAARPDLRRDGELAKPAAVGAVARGHAIESGLHSERDVVREKEFRPGAD